MVEEVVRDFLKSDATLMGMLEGDIITFNETGRNGIGIDTTQDLYDGVYLKSSIMVKLRSLNTRLDIRDTGENVNSANGILEIWFYDDGDNGFEDILDAQERVYNILPKQFITGAGHFRWVGDLVNLRDNSLENAAVVRSDFRLIKIRG